MQSKGIYYRPPYAIKKKEKCPHYSGLWMPQIKHPHRVDSTASFSSAGEFCLTKDPLSRFTLDFYSDKYWLWLNWHPARLDCGRSDSIISCNFNFSLDQLGWTVVTSKRGEVDKEPLFCSSRFERTGTSMEFIKYSFKKQLGGLDSNFIWSAVFIIKLSLRQYFSGQASEAPPVPL